MSRLIHACTSLALLFAASCGDTGRTQIKIPLRARGTEARDIEVEGGTLRLQKARVALGPLYLCATESAEAELCETALAQWLDAKSIDALDEAPVALGELDATTGTVQSGFFDYGITWLLTSQGPETSEGAADGHSATLTFDVLIEGRDPIEVRAAIDVEPLGPGDAAVNALRTDRELGEGDSLTVIFDPSSWLRRVRVSDLVALDSDADGRVKLSKNDQAYEAILQGMTVNATPRLEWR